MPSLGVLLGDSSGVMAVREQVGRLLRSSPRRLPPLLILGETGTGKGLLASTIHRASGRASGPFVDVNCSAIPETLVEAELFGFERGAFTDARQAKAGLFQAANGGTIFLDEVGLLPLAMQAKLLKVIEERSVRRLGSTHSEPLDVSVMAATSEDLPAAVQAGRFRADLYHRLAVVTLTLPPLRTRGADVVLLAEHFLRRTCEDYGLPAKTVSEDAKTALVGYGWPGNVRELGNVLERAALLTDGSRLTASDLALPELAPTSSPPGGDRAVDEAERRELQDLLASTEWNFSRAAARSGIPRNTLRYRVDRLGLAGPPGRRRGGRPRGARQAPPLPPGAAAGGPVQERRRVTFLDTRLISDDRAGGSWELQRALAATIGKIASFGGRIEESSEDGVLAVFGLEPDEDAPRRAAHAALAVQNLAIRARREDERRPRAVAALHTGSVSVLATGERVELDPTAGPEVRRALEAVLRSGAPGKVVASAAASRFLVRRFELVPIGDAARPTAWHVVRSAEPGRTRFVGRQDELRLLRERFARAQAGHGQVVMLTGEAGVGKSRLVHELRRELGASATWVEGHALSFGRAMAFHPIIEMLKAVFRIDDGDPASAVGAKIEAGVHRLGDDLGEVLPFLRSLLSVDRGEATLAGMDPRLQHAQIVRATQLLLERGAEQRPHVVVVEDAHWADPATEDWLDRVAEGLGTKRVLLVVTARPGYRPLGSHLPFHSTFALSSLSSSETARIVADLVGTEAVPPELEPFIADKADGNPFFVEELVRSLQELAVIRKEGADLVVTRPLGDVGVPETIHDVIMARIERLADGPRRVLRLASVIGREFTLSVLARVAEPAMDLEGALRGLAAAGLILERRLFPEVEYAFSHALTHDVAYVSVPGEERRALHRRVAHSLEAVHGDRLADVVPLLAHHYAAAEDWERALVYLVRAADSAAGSFATREALALYDQAVQVAARVPGGTPATTMLAIHQARSQLYFVLSDFARSYAAAAAMRDLARAVGDREQEGVALAAQAWAATWARDLESAVAHARSAIAVAEPIVAHAVLARAQFTVGFVRGVTGGIGEAKAAVAATLTASRSAGDVVHESLGLSFAGLMKSWEGEYAEADRLQRDALALARQHNLLVPLLFNAFLRGLTLAAMGDYGTALETFDTGLTLSEKIGDEAIHHRLLNCLGALYSELGDLDTATRLNHRSAEIGRRRGDDGTMANAEINLGDVCLARGDLGAAATIFERVERLVNDVRTSPWMRFRYSNRLWASMGELALARGDLEGARARAEQCLELATRTNARKNLVRGWRLTGATATAAGQWDTAHDALGRAVALAETIGNPTQLWRAHAALGDYHVERGEKDAARRAYRAARTVIDRILTGLPTPELGTSLEKLTLVREVTRRAAS